MNVRVVDMFKLVAAGSSAGCSAAMRFNAGYGSTGTIMPKLFGKCTDFYGGLSGDDGTVLTFAACERAAVVRKVGRFSHAAPIGSSTTAPRCRTRI